MSIVSLIIDISQCLCEFNHDIDNTDITLLPTDSLDEIAILCDIGLQMY